MNSASEPARRTTIGRLRVQAPVTDGLLLRLRASSLLEALDMRAGRLPAHAILAIRRLRDPLPRQVSLGSAQMRPPERWRLAVERTLDRAAAQAVRAATTTVPAAAQAVWFADRAELLSCLALDWLEGQASAAWWWRALYGSRDLSEVVVSAWRESPAFVPDAVDQLARAGQAARFARALPLQSLAAMTSELLGCFGLSPVASQMPAEGGHEAKQAAGAERSRASEALPLSAAGSGKPTTDLARSPLGSGMRALLHEVRDLESSRATWLAVALALVRLPREARSPHFADELHSAIAQSQVIETPLSNTSPGAACSTASGVGMVPTQASSARAQPRGPAAVARSRARPVKPIQGPAEPVDERGAFASLRSGPDGVADAAPAHGETATDSSPVAVGTQLWPADTAQPLDAGPLVVHTRHGGVFFLLNLALTLGLYSDFTQPQGQNLALSPWDFLDLCADDLLEEHIGDDPVRHTLGQLAGRNEDEAAGAGTALPESWRLPTFWLAAFAQRRGVWAWHDDGERLRVRHPTGFWVIDVGRSAEEAQAQLTREMAPYRALARVRLPAQAARPVPWPADELQRWRACVMPYLAQRLALALGMRSPQHAARLVCRIPARIELSPARLDLHMRLADLPIAVRRAGLDRDPGWIPAAGRDVRFHFDADED